MFIVKVAIAGKLTEIRTHDGSHLDEDAAIWMAKDFGTEEFLSKYAPNGVLEIGIGGGPFDEHATAHADRKEDECAATLMAKALGIENDPALEKILKFVRQRDLNGNSQPFDLDSIVKAMNSAFPNDPEMVLEFAMNALRAKYREQLEFHAAKKAFMNAKAQEVEGPGGRMLRVVIAESDAKQLSKVAFSAFGNNCAVLIQKRSSGHVQIFTNKKLNLTLYDVVQSLRYEEQAIKGKFQTTDFKELSLDGVVLGAEEWYFQESGQMILNGSLTKPDVPPTKLTLERIVEIVRIGISPAKFHHDCETCDSTRGNPCPWFSWGLQRCRALRYDERSNKI